MTEYKEGSNQYYIVTNWSAEDAHLLFTQLEQPNWAPWLAASEETLAGRAFIFPQGQLMIKDREGKPLASLSMNRISWNGNLTSLPSWDEVAGEPTTYEKTYAQYGNTLVMMSMNVNPEHQGQGYARSLIAEAKQLGQTLGIEYIIGSFRPNEYGKHKLNFGKKSATFKKYCELIRPDGLPVDAWLRNLSRNGMKHLKVDKKAMVVPVTLKEFEEYKNSFNLNQWVEVEPNTWECGEVGTWHVDVKNDTAVYIESNMWGLL
ncbi:MAG TPA: GNAT family N-acetyltransferase [Candidatus Saccharimonadales bacterium]|nr:GNAT family N-acetyltransferase [Candidatus Saccharimonadales bacterium]